MKRIAIAGNPNVGKSTLFNALTGLHQHTGNWPGKTVGSARGYFKSGENTYELVDIPGTYSLMSHSEEEEIARDYICFEKPDAVIVVCDAVCLERNFNLVLQIMEISDRVLICINMMDEAEKKHINIDMEGISSMLGVPVIGVEARKKKSLQPLVKVLDSFSAEASGLFRIQYAKPLEEAVEILEPVLQKQAGDYISCRWLALRILEADCSFRSSLLAHFKEDIYENAEVKEALQQARSVLNRYNISEENVKDKIVEGLVKKAEQISRCHVSFESQNYNERDRRIDKILTGRLLGYPAMALLLAFTFWLTISGANYPSALLSSFFFYIEDRLMDFALFLNCPGWLSGVLITGMYRVLAWVVSVMLPPMAIFFPLFSLLENIGYLPRIAYNLDKCFQKCHACGKQALTMCMGFGCNAAGVIGCRIIDSDRERLIAMLTNNFVPCNGRFPVLIAIIGICGFSAVPSAVFLTLIVLIGIGMTFFASRLLSATILKGKPSFFTIELPPYRRPQIGRVLIRSILDRTVFVLGRAVLIAAPAGIVIWLTANITVGGTSLLLHCTRFLDPFASLLGMDGVILTAFILGLPANEIVIPIMIMAYMATGTIADYESLSSLKLLLEENGWTWITAVSTCLFTIMHWPCSTTLLTIKKEAGGMKWMLLAFLLPALTGILVCFLFTWTAHLFF